MFFTRRPIVVIIKEIHMADLTKLETDMDALTAKLEAYLAAQAVPIPPVDDQPAVDALDAKVEVLIAKIP